ncbi:MAG TPA: PE family protein [Mycobacterium sp.]|nr:PE family protein [Mycobacterium sp.]
MLNVMAAPEMIAAAATDVAAVGSTLSAAHMAAAAPTVAVIPAAADEVSASIAHLFSAAAQDYQGLAGQAAAFHAQFVQHLTASAGSFASAEAANVSLLQPLTASAASIGSAISALPGQAINILTSLRDQLIGFLNTLGTIASLAFIGAFFAALSGLFIGILAFFAPLWLLVWPTFLIGLLA